MSQPTQVRRPWRATVRTVVQGVLAFLVLLPFIVDATGLEPEVYPWLAGMLAVAAAITRVMALPRVETFLRRFLPWLAADPGRDARGEGGFMRLKINGSEFDAWVDVPPFRGPVRRTGSR